MTRRRVLLWGAPLLMLAVAILLWRLAQPDPDTLPGALAIATTDITRTLTPEDRRGSFGLDMVFNRFVPRVMPLARRRALLEEAGFACAPTRPEELICARAAPGSAVTCAYRWHYDTRPEGRQEGDYGGVPDIGYLSISC